MKTRKRITPRLSFLRQKLRYRAFKYVFVVLTALISLGPINGIAGQEPRNKNIQGIFNTVSLAQRSIIQTVPLWGGSIISFDSRPAREAKTVGLHHFDLPCENCHGNDEAISTGKMKSQNYVQKRININRTCTSLGCHDYDTVLNHPVNVSVNSSIPEDMPLDGSLITCLTCHNQPKSSSLTDDINGSRERLLRIPNEENFCSSCHTKMPGNQKKLSHWRFSSLAHLGKINLKSDPSRNSVKNVGNIDIESRTCLSCHQDITVTIPGENETASHKRNRWRNMKDHPIGMEYSRIAMLKSSRYRYPLTHNEHIRLFDGKVGCGSCHSLYSGEKGNLVQSNIRSALCFECHDM